MHCHVYENLFSLATVYPHWKHALSRVHNLIPRLSNVFMRLMESRLHIMLRTSIVVSLRSDDEVTESNLYPSEIPTDVTDDFHRVRIK